MDSLLTLPATADKLVAYAPAGGSAIMTAYGWRAAVSLSEDDAATYGEAEAIYLACQAGEQHFEGLARAAILLQRAGWQVGWHKVDVMLDHIAHRRRAYETSVRVVEVIIMEAVEGYVYENAQHVQFVEDMRAAGYTVRHYAGRYSWKGPAVAAASWQEVAQATSVPLQYDSLGLRLIVYPVARGACRQSDVD